VSQFDRWLFRHPKTVSAIFGLLIGIVMLGLSAIALLVQLRNETQEHQAERAQKIAKASSENRQIIAQLKSGHVLDCSQESLARLNQLLFTFSGQSDIGLYDSNGLLYCTARVGRLTKPIADPEIVNYSADGDPMWFNIPTPAGGPEGKALVIRHGGFNVSMSPRTILDLSGGSDIVWIGKSHEPVRLDSAIPAAVLAQIKANELAGRYGWTMLWSEGVGVALMKVEGTQVRLANILPLLHAFTRNAGLTALLLLFSCALGVLVTFALRPRIIEATSLKRRLPSLLTTKNVRCVYQPIIELATGRPVGCEVLMRLQRDEELLYPDSFIGLAQELGITWKLDKVVIETALRELKTLDMPADRFSVAFNLFPASVRHEQIHSLFENSPDRSGLVASAIVIGLEVTEYDFSDALIPELQLLRQAGYHIAVDDFVTGYSNLNTVKKVAPDLLKIDKSFVFEMEDATARSSLIPEIVGIAKAVNACVVAEGVEQESQAKQLLALGVHYGQGYHFARPLNLSDFADYLRGHGVIA
jgi:sensor c-di-GMP phosphodiesterase-like protein